MTNEEKAQKEENLMNKAIEQSKQLQKQAKFNKMSLVEQNIAMFKEMREKDPIKRSFHLTKIVNLSSAEFAFMQGKKEEIFDFQGIYIMSKDVTNTVHFTNKGFLRLIKGDSLEIEVTLNKTITKE